MTDQRSREGLRIAVTGMATWCCFGRGLGNLVDSLVAGRRQLCPVDRLDTTSSWFRTTIGAQAPSSIATVPSKEDPWQWAVAEAIQTAVDAYADAGLDGSAYNAGRVGVLNATTHGTHGLLLFIQQRLKGSTPDPNLLSESAAAVGCQIGRVLDARGPNITVNTACSSGLNSIGQAAQLLLGGQIDCCVVGGNDILTHLTYLGFNSLGVLARTPCRPFDRERDGLTLGDGAAYLVLEREADARRRNARIRAFVTGYASSGEGYHPTAPDPAGRAAIQVMESALAQDARPEELAMVCAHGTGTQANDEMEATAIGSVINNLKVPGPVYVFSLKSWLGHTLGAAGALETVATLACMEQGIIPGTIGLVNPVAHTSALRFPQAPIHPDRYPTVALCNSFGFGGSVASLCLRRK